MALSQRYPSKPAGQNSTYGVDMSAILPPGVGVTTPALQFFTNANPPGIATGITASNGGYLGRRVWTMISGGVAGTDYQVQWTFTDTTGNTWVRTFLLLVAATS